MQNQETISEEKKENVPFEKKEEENEASKEDLQENEVQMPDPHYDKNYQELLRRLSTNEEKELQEQQQKQQVQEQQQQQEQQKQKQEEQQKPILAQKKFSEKFDLQHKQFVKKATSAQNILDYNKQWAAKIKETEPHFFQELSLAQTPQFLWIGCADSRVPAERLTGLGPGELFVHRNVANQVIHTDLNCLSVVQFAVEVLKVTDIIICGHYKCGGVNAAINNVKLGLINNWLHHIRDIYLRYKDKIDSMETFEEKSDKMCELNILQQIYNLGNSTILQDAWARGQKITIHAWIYNLKDGLITELDYVGKGKEAQDQKHDIAVDALFHH